MAHARQIQETIELGVKAPLVSLRSWDHLVEPQTLDALARLLPGFLRTRRWFGGKARTMNAAEIVDVVPMRDIDAYIAFARVEYNEGDPETYIIPVSVARGEAEERARQQFGDTIVAQLRAADGTTGVLYGAIHDPRFRDALLGLVARRRKLHGQLGEVVGSHSRMFRKIWGASHPALESAIMGAEQSNTSITYGDRFILKLFRKVEPGVNPDIEIGSYLTNAGFTNTPAFAGHIEYRPHGGQETVQIATVQALVRTEGDAWKYTIDSLSTYFETALAHTEGDPSPQELIGTYLESARLLGQRTAEMHLALAWAKDPAFTPEPFTDHYRQGLYHGFIAQANRSLQLLRNQLSALPESSAALARSVLDQEAEIRERFRPLRAHRITGMRIRHHGDYHLGQVLYTGKDFVIIDFEGEPARALSERRLKRSALRDVAGMMRSFQYAAYAALFGKVAGVVPRPENMAALEQWAGFWTWHVSEAFLRAYLEATAGAAFLPASEQELRILLDVYVMDKALYEISYELNNRPDWVRIPLAGILRLTGSK
jgi:maltose alpha-D-glucosyltransferase/alpha-amylase